MFPTTCPSRFAAVGSMALLLGLQGCDGLSDVDDQPTRAPQAVATAIGYAGSNADGDVSFNVRSQAEVLLSGNNSIESDAAILTFLWEPQNDAARAATATIRNLNTINVAIPTVTAPTDLIFRLTVRESDGDTDTATATLHVQPALDSNRFLTPVGRSARLRVVAATLQPVAAGGEFELRLKSRVTYTTRNGLPNTVEFDIGAPIQGQWQSNVGSGGDSATDFRNPVFDFPVPSFDADDVTRLFQATLPGSSDNLPDPAFVDDTDIEVIASLTSPTLLAQSVLFVLDAEHQVVARQANGNNGLPTELTLTPEQVEALRISGGGLENKATARAYYAAIDPDDEKASLRAWLSANCFDPDAENFGADAHAIYTNNFDLGFGRDMYFRTARPANCTSASFGPGDSAAVVINYPTLEGAAKKLDPIIAVAMEYKATDPDRSQPGLVTFYAFAPDERTGEFPRVLSANFDGRGEKYLPGSCTACHGGRPLTPAPNALDTYALSADVGATFMPWDLESFLYSDTDPAFPTDASNAGLRGQFTRALQEGEFRKLNLAAYATYGGGQPFQCHAAFDGPCELVHIWYGGTDLPSATFLDRQIAPGWLQGGPDNNPPEAEQIYLDAFARNCRACHVQRVQDPTGEIDPQLRTYAELLMEGATVSSLTFDEGAMPAARLTMDRFWTTGAGGASAGDLLAESLGVAAPAAPGRPLACVGPDNALVDPTLSSDSANRGPIVRNSPVSQSAACSQFPGGIDWELTVPSGSATALVGTDTARASFLPDQPGDYDLTLRLTGLDGTTQSSTSRFAVVPNLLPVALTVNGGSTFNVNPPPMGTPLAVDVFATPNGFGDAPATVTYFNATNLTFTQGVEGLVTVTPTSTSNGSLGYTITDIDGDTATNTVQLAVQPTGSLVANDDMAAAVTANSVVPRVVNVLANDFTAGLNVVVTASATGTCQGRLNTRATVTVNADKTISYVPPRALVTSAAYDGPTAGCTSFDSFTYTIQFPPLAPSTGTVRVPVNGTRFFSQVFGIMINTSPNTDTCAGNSCHSITTNGWVIGTQAATYNQLRNDPPDGDPGVYIDLREVESGGDTSLLLLKALGQSHGGGEALMNLGNIATFRTWLEEGAYNN